MRRVLIKYEESISKHLSLLQGHCIKEVNSHTHNCLILILTEDGYTICKKILPNNIIKSVTVDVYDGLAHSNTPRQCREIINSLPFPEMYIYGRKSENMIGGNYSIRFKGFFSESEFASLNNNKDSILLFKNRNLVRVNCLTPINNFLNLQIKLSNDLKNNIYDIFDFEPENHGRFSLCLDINKIDVLNKLDYLKIVNINIFENYNLK